MRPIACLLSLALLAACATSSVTPISQNQFILNTSAAPACKSSGAQKVATQMAAIETLRRGYERYVVLGARGQNNTAVGYIPPSGSYTQGTVNVYGNTAYGRATTQYFGGGPVVLGSHDAQLAVLMLKPSDDGYGTALDAKTVLGQDWKKMVEKGVATCT